MRESRVSKGLSAEKLAEQMRELGVPFDKTVVANLETGRRRFVTVQEALALSYVLDIALVHLIVPTDDEETPVRITPVGPEVRPDIARGFIRGQEAVGDVDVRRYATQVPKHEFGPDRWGLVSAAQLEAQMMARYAESGADVEVERDDVTGMRFMRPTSSEKSSEEVRELREQLRKQFPMLFEDQGGTGGR